MNFGIAHIVNPKRLLFEGIDMKDFQWNYFRLELDYLPASYVYKLSKRQKELAWSEELLELEPGEYLNMHYWEINEYEGEPLPQTARIVTRMFKGSLVIFAKSSIYNDISTYEGRHDRVGAEEFRNHIEKMRLDYL